ncbi:MAG: DUF354 domain-containing protein [Pyrinomonadaceae bacterium]
MAAIWIDLDNSPHVPLFAPIIKHYRDRGVEVIVTARDHAQTIELLNLYEFQGTYSVIGRHYGKSKIDKIRGLLARAKQLVSHIKKQDKEISLTVSHGSRSMVLAARWLKIPIVTMYDYEFTETRIFNIFSNRVLVPDRIPESTLNEIGLPIYKRGRYPGIKEELYIAKFQPAENFRETLFATHDVSGHKVLAILRPPATTANYHDARGEILLTAIIEQLLSSSETFTLISPRTREQAAEIREIVASRPDFTAPYVILDEAVDGLDLIYAADLVISGGGTMNREAALLGVPVYSIFAGRQGALDKQMESEGLITFIRDNGDLSKIKLKRRKPSSANGLTARVEKFVIREIDRYLT